MAFRLKDCTISGHNVPLANCRCNTLFNGGYIYWTPVLVMCTHPLSSVPTKVQSKTGLSPAQSEVEIFHIPCKRKEINWDCNLGKNENFHENFLNLFYGCLSSEECYYFADNIIHVIISIHRHDITIFVGNGVEEYEEREGSLLWNSLLIFS